MFSTHLRYQRVIRNKNRLLLNLFGEVNLYTSEGILPRVTQMGAIIHSRHDLIKFWSKRWHEPLNIVATSEAWHKFFVKLIMHGGEYQNIQIYECNYQKWKKFEYVRVRPKWVCSKKYACQVCFTSLCGILPVCFNRILGW